jgi:superfamily II DNA or RNA helicase
MHNLTNQTVDRVLIVTANHMLVNQYDQLMRSHFERMRAKVEYATYITLTGRLAALAKNPSGVSTFLLMDEVHNLSMHSLLDTYEQLWLALHAPTAIKKCLLMTATPIIDVHTELYRIMNLLIPADRQNDPAAWNGLVSVHDQPCSPWARVVYVRHCPGTQGTTIPATSDEPVYIDIPMNELERDEYMHMARTTSANATSGLAMAAVNGSKFEAVVADILAHPTAKVFVSCGFINKCTELAALLSKRTNETRRIYVAFSEYTALELRVILEAFNKAPDSAVLIATRVFNEGISLKNVTRVHLLSPFWNLSRVYQTVSRAVRFDSHDTPSVVYVHMYRTTLPSVNSVDVHMSVVAREKHGRKVQELQTLKAASIETLVSVSDCARTKRPKRPVCAVPCVDEAVATAAGWFACVRPED